MYNANKEQLSASLVDKNNVHIYRLSVGRSKMQTKNKCKWENLNPKHFGSGDLVVSKVSIGCSEQSQYRV